MKKLNSPSVFLFFIIATVLFGIYFFHHFRIYNVQGSSMEPTLHSNQLLLLDLQHGRFQANDIIVFRYKEFFLIKRIVEAPADVTLKKDEYYVLGDNREHSIDSRTFGPIHKSQIIGVVRLI